MSSNRALTAIRPALRVSTRQASMTSQTSDFSDQKALWKQINKLGSEGKWDSVNNTPKMFLFGNSKKEAYSAYNAFNKSDDIFTRSAYGPYLKIVFRVALLLSIIKLGVVVYEFVVPEQKRLKIKYAQHGVHH